MAGRGTDATMFSRFSRVLALCLLAFCLNGCEEQRDPDLIKVWTALEGKELDTLRGLCKDSGLKVLVLKVPFAQLKSKFMVASPAGQGPDLVVGPQDWLGVFTTAQLLAPIPEANAAKLREDTMETAIQGVSQDGKMYAAPLMLDCLALIRNTKLQPTAPATLPELLAAADAQPKPPQCFGFYYDIEDLYFSWPFFASQGCVVFRNGLEPGCTGPEAVAAVTFLKALRDHKLCPVGAKSDFAKSLFLDGKVAMTLNGPWFLGDIRAAKVPYAIDPIPGGPMIAAPFVGITGLMLNARAANPEKAMLLLDFLTSSESEVKLALASGRPPARKGALALAGQDPDVGKDIVAFARVAENGVPMPVHPASSAIWDPMKQAIILITTGEAKDPTQQMQQTRTSIENKIRQMME